MELEIAQGDLEKEKIFKELERSKLVKKKKKQLFFFLIFFLLEFCFQTNRKESFEIQELGGSPTTINTNRKKCKKFLFLKIILWLFFLFWFFFLFYFRLETKGKKISLLQSLMLNCWRMITLQQRFSFSKMLLETPKSISLLNLSEKEVFNNFWQLFLVTKQI